MEESLGKKRGDGALVAEIYWVDAFSFIAVRQ